MYFFCFFVLFSNQLLAFDAIIEWPFFEKQTQSGTRIEYEFNRDRFFIKFKKPVQYQYGDLVRVQGNHRQCRPPKNPGMFNECRWWYQQGIDYQLDVTLHSLKKSSQKQPFFIYCIKRY